VSHLGRLERLEQEGFVVIPGVVVACGMRAVIEHLQELSRSSAGSRAMLGHDWCAALAETLKQHVALQPFLPVDAVALQYTLFDKSPAKNWLVASPIPT
jgi:hypothetical protein